MARYRVLIKTSAVREIEAIPQKSHRQRVVSKIRALAEDRPRGCEKLTAQDRYRIVYSIEDDALVVIVVRVGQRGQVYR